MNNLTTHIYFLLIGVILLFLQGCSTYSCKCLDFEASENIEISSDNFDERRYRVGEKMSFLISVKRPLYLHCFYVSGNVVKKLNPSHSTLNRGITHPVRQGLPIKVDGMYADKPIGTAQVSCIGSSDVLLYALPKNISYAEIYKKLEYTSMQSIYEEFQKVAKSPLMFKSINISITD